MRIPSDTVHHITDTIVASADRDWATTSAVSLILKDFTHAMHTRTFHFVKVSSLERCTSLLSILNAHKTSHTFIASITVIGKIYGFSRLGHDSAAVDAPWYLTAHGCELFNKLSSLSRLDLAQMNPGGDTVRQLAIRTLALRRHDITHLQLACRCIMTLGSLDCLILHLPSLHIVTIHRDAICEIHVK
jgi:hypothetical protein